ncbi:hypothetical protein Fot_10945 [Forsythia ovata]|uniref:Uncharacterized protein n=1 Tax=Forsythia ovata TaxID=205694 RepID=A0ABD1WIY1_9LAMI
MPESHQTDDKVENSKKMKYTNPVVECSDAGRNHSISKSSSEFLDDDLVFTEEDLRNMDESVAKHVVGCHKVTSQVTITQSSKWRLGVFVIKFAEYIFGRKIKEIPKKFDTKVAHHNMAV